MTDMADWEVAEKAADYIDEHGWARFTLENDSGQVCALGAIGKHTDCKTYSDFLHNATAANFANYLIGENMLEGVKMPTSGVEPFEPVSMFNDSIADDANSVTQALRDFAIKVRPDDA